MMCEGKIQHNSYYQECLFYLHSYGTNLAIISFYMRHDCMREALLHLLNKVSNSVFIAETEIQKAAMSVMQSLGGLLWRSLLRSWNYVLQTIQWLPGIQWDRRTALIFTDLEKRMCSFSFFIEVLHQQHFIFFSMMLKTWDCCHRVNLCLHFCNHWEYKGI